MIRFQRRWAPGGLALLLALPLAACSDSTSPDDGELEAVVGTYALTTLRFDPQGTLPDQDILAALGNSNTQLILTSDRAAQVVYRDPVTQLFVTIQGTFRTTSGGVRLEWASNSQYRQLLLSRTMNFTFNAGAGTLVFDAEAPDGVLRARLQALVPAFQGEQLLDPTPGRLQVTFTGS
jgi:hypothetical protein